jgi:hemoglobin-like flavoprotein
MCSTAAITPSVRRKERRMTPHDITLICSDVDRLDSGAFSQYFYDTLFELAPDARAMFPAEMDEQRRKLMSELAALIELGTAAGAGRMGDFVTRAQRLGRRHERYGATGGHYELVGVALLAALRQSIDDWDADHEHAWRVLYATVAETMREGAAMRPPTDVAAMVHAD